MNAPSCGGAFCMPGDEMPGRWPANVILSPGSARMLDQQSGVLKSGSHKPGHRRTTDGGNGNTHGAMAGVTGPEVEANEGGASRFFLTAGYEPWELEWIIANGLTPCGE